MLRRTLAAFHGRDGSALGPAIYPTTRVGAHEQSGGWARVASHPGESNCPTFSPDGRSLGGGRKPKGHAGTIRRGVGETGPRCCSPRQPTGVSDSSSFSAGQPILGWGPETQGTRLHPQGRPGNRPPLLFYTAPHGHHLSFPRDLRLFLDLCERRSHP